MIYFDGIHLLSDESLEELHSFASKIGMKREWFQVSQGGIPHYDVWGSMEQRALNAGAKWIAPGGKLLEVFRKIRAYWGNGQGTESVQN